MKKAISILLACVILFAFTACSGGSSGGTQTGGTTGNTTTSSGNSGTSSDASSATSETADTGIDTSQRVTITYMTTGDIPSDSTNEVLAVLNEKLIEKVNAEIKIHWIEWTDYTTNYNLTLAAQDGTIDLVGTATDWLNAWPNAKDGAFLELTEELLSTYAPKTWAQVPAEDWDKCKLDGKIYLMPEDNYAQWVNHGFMYRGDWAKEAGLTNGAHSWADMRTYFQYVKDNKEHVIPWDAQGSGTSIFDALAGGWLTSHSNSINVEGLRVGLFYGESPENPYKLTRYFLEGDELVNFAKEMKEWNDAGFWRQDVLNNSISTRDEFYIGNTGADQHHTETWYGTVRPRMDKDNPGSDVGFFYFGEETGNVVSMNITHGAMAVAAKSKNPERALMVYDLLRNDEEIYRLFNYGIEGKQYVIDENGYRAWPEGYVEDTDKSTTNFWWGRNDDLELRDARRAWDLYLPLVDIYNQKAVDYPYGQVVFNLDPIDGQLNNLSNVYNTYMAQIAFGKAADPEAYVAEFRNALKAAGYEEVIAEVESQLAAVYGN